MDDTRFKETLKQLHDNSCTEVNLESQALSHDELRLLAGALLLNRSVESLNLRDTGLKDKDLPTFATLAERHPALNSLDVAENELTDNSARVLSDLIRTKKDMYVDFNDNTFTASGATALFRAEIEKGTLNGDFSHMPLGEEGGRMALEVLGGNPCTRRLSLEHTELGDRGAGYVAEMIEKNSRLRELNLKGNEIDLGAIAIADALRKNKTLNLFSLEDNSIGQDGLIAMAEMLKFNRSLVECNLNDNAMSPRALEALTEAVRENKNLIQVVSDYGGEPVTEITNLTKEHEEKATALLDSITKGKKLTRGDCKELKDRTALVTYEAINERELPEEDVRDLLKVAQKRAASFGIAIEIPHLLKTEQSWKRRTQKPVKSFTINL